MKSITSILLSSLLITGITGITAIPQVCGTCCKRDVNCERDNLTDMVIGAISWIKRRDAAIKAREEETETDVLISYNGAWLKERKAEGEVAV